MKPFPRSDSVDVMFLLEGTFPYVYGGVSSWVDQIIRSFPEYSFGAVFLGSRPEDYNGLKYELPSNLKHLEAHYLYAEDDSPAMKQAHENRETMEIIRELHASFLKGETASLEGTLTDTEFYFSPANGVDHHQFLYSVGSWDFITDSYRGKCTDPSFIDYFWTVRCMHAPLWKLASIARSLIPARLYHTVSTGYAGFLGALARGKSRMPLILTEHGIYTKERRIDLLHSEWIKDNSRPLQKDLTEISYYRSLWIRFFETIGRICYASSNAIVSLYEGARQQEIEDGAKEERTHIIPNGIDLGRFTDLRSRTAGEPQPVLSLIGRIVPIKDIKTFIRAIRILTNRIPEIEGWIVGPGEEDPAYEAECRALVESLHISNNVRFMGMKDVSEVFPGTGVLVLSSISEGLPLVVLESFAAGVPVITTDVGACRQLVRGCGAEDEALGDAGAVIGINDEKSLADAAFNLLRCPDLWRKARSAAIERVTRYYSRESLVERYRALYEKGMSGWQE